MKLANSNTYNINLSLLILEINFGEITYIAMYIYICYLFQWSNLMVSEIRTHQFCLTSAPHLLTKFPRQL